MVRSVTRQVSGLEEAKDPLKRATSSKDVFKSKRQFIQETNKVRDEFEYATNWSRVFSDIYQHLKWLNAFAEINQIAMEKVLMKFSGVYFEDKENSLHYDLKSYIESR